MSRKALVISPELCIGCRGCQTACKSWNQLPATKTVNKGTTENPPDLTPNLYNKIRYVEIPSDSNPVRWLFVSQRCMHCDDAGCMKICPAPGALFKTKEGAVGFDKENALDASCALPDAPLMSRDTMKKTRLQSATFALTEYRRDLNLPAQRRVLQERYPMAIGIL